MAIIINIDVMLAKRKMSVTELTEKVGITMANLSILKNGKAKAIRFSTLEAICKALDCQPGDILEYKNNKSYEIKINNICETRCVFHRLFSAYRVFCSSTRTCSRRIGREANQCHYGNNHIFSFCVYYKYSFFCRTLSHPQAFKIY